jgi:hypothetical protein
MAAKGKKNPHEKIKLDIQSESPYKGSVSRLQAESRMKSWI